MNHRQRTATGLVAAVTATSLVLAIAPSASADVRDQRSQKAAAGIERITGTQDLAPSSAAPGAAAQSVTQTESGTVTVRAPEDATGNVKATAPDGTAFGLGLPQAKSVEGVKAGSGTIVYPDAADSTDLAVQPTKDGGARTLVTLKDKDAPTEQRFDLQIPAGAHLAANDSGGYDIFQDTGKGFTTLKGTISAPWAKDANGKGVATSYKLEGSTLVQSIDTNSTTTFPVVADPHYTWGIVSGTVYFNKSETRKIALGGGLAATIIASIPAGFTTAAGITVAAITTMANIAQSHKKCLKIKSYGKPGEYSGKQGDGYCR
ncbi:hypothetical protein [Streptomyces sp. KN37]|uniref:hypothetical protein n=1 Tax=Streptomyces sp. KN37 TaxID=3090667 RepID=UPI002A74C227|nr:hypothetical protein [Streptomyces sp. KN37]WPO76643.1 hypothetical protein R9806_39050 [Streptomyces sp. KN37]